VDYLVEASARLGRLIDDLLELSRVGRVINTPRAFSWDHAVSTVISDLQDLIHTRRAEVTVEGPLPAVIGDPERVIQLLTNLVSNGLKYNQNERPLVVIGHRPAPEGAAGPRTALPGEGAAAADVRQALFDRPAVTLFVRDNGEGIPECYHEEVFGLFR